MVTKYTAILFLEIKSKPNMKTIIKLFLLFFCVSTYAQTTVKGNVSDQNGQPLPGANIIVVGTTSGAVTDFDGNFTLTPVNKTHDSPIWTLDFSIILIQLLLYSYFLIDSFKFTWVLQKVTMYFY